MRQHQLLIEKALKMGCKAQNISHLVNQSASILTFNEVSELVVDGVPTSWTSRQAELYCDNKQLTKLVFENLHIPYPKSLIFDKYLSENQRNIENFIQPNKKYVCKPLDGTNGHGIQLNMTDFAGVKSYFEQFQNYYAQFILEEQIEGKDLRIQVVGGKLIAVCTREPAFVLGNGKDSIEQLITDRQAIVKTQNPLNSLEIDEIFHQLLHKQHLKLTDVPTINQKVILKNVSNMAQGGVATDVTDQVHSMYFDWVRKLCQELKMSYMGLDFMTTDYTKNPMENAYILEINARADWLHHTFSEHQTHDMAQIISDELFTNL